MAQLNLYKVINVPYIFTTENNKPRDFYVLEWSDGRSITGQLLFTVLRWDMANFGLPNPFHPITHVVRDIVWVYPDISIKDFKLTTNHEFDKNIDELMLEQVEFNENNIDILSTLRNTLNVFISSIRDALNSGQVTDGLVKQNLFINYQFLSLVLRSVIRKFREIVDASGV